MAEEIFNEQVQNTIFGMSDLITYLIVGLVVLILFGFIIFTIIQMLSYKHRIVIRVVAKERKYILQDKFKVTTDKDGVTWYKLLKRKHKLPVAPPEAVEITSKGRIFIEAYYTDHGEYIYVSEELDRKQLNEFGGIGYVAKKPTKFETDRIKERMQSGKYVYLADKNKSIESLQPFKQKQRLILINQYKKARALEKKGWQEQLPTLVSIGAIVIILVVLFAFWQDITRPMLDSMNTMGSIAETQAEITAQLKEIILERQSVSDGGGTVGQIKEAPQ